MRILILYSTVDGHTQKICERISDLLVIKNIVEVINVNNADQINLTRYDFIIVGASIRYGKYRRNLIQFINKNIIFLERSKTAFFSVNIVARKDEKNSITTNPYIKIFHKATNWNPDIISVFAGKLEYPKYNFFNKLIIRFIMWITNGPTNPSSIIEFTNWDKVKKFASDIDNFKEKNNK